MHWTSMLLAFLLRHFYYFSYSLSLKLRSGTTPGSNQAQPSRYSVQLIKTGHPLHVGTVGKVQGCNSSYATGIRYRFMSRLLIREPEVRV